MANTLTNLIPIIYAALDQVSREMVGFIPAVTRNSGIERAAKDQSVRVPIAPAVSLANNTPAVTAPDTGDQTIDNVEITIASSKHAPIRWSGEETRALQLTGTYAAITQNRFVQAFRALTNAVETDIAALYAKASRAYGTAGTAPFGTAADLSDAANANRILDDNGAPTTDRQLVVGAAAMANLRGKQSVLFKINEAGTDQMLRDGILGRLQGFDVRNSGQVAAHTKGTGANYLVNDGTPPAVGDTSITTDTGTGTILAGDVITLAGDTNKYIVTTALAANVVVIAKPGLRAAADDDDAITVGNSYTANMAFSRSAIVLATRLPARPEQGDMADDVTTVVDPLSGLAFEVAMYRQYRQVHIEVALAWGCQLIKPEHVAILLG